MRAGQGLESTVYDELSFQQLKHWFEANVGAGVSVQVTSQRGTVAFLDGTIDGLMGFESTDSRGVSVYGAGGAWTLELAEPEFASATLSPIPSGCTLTQLTIKMRDHWLSIVPGVDPAISRTRV